ncbi:hypothetical protein [Geminisphaera colitermitum]|uniref:hypothetical protein n=1 Tax=Geminisphaera colitermitum TaxID=1148786 RepID=UPI000196550C|nr:hypothetical protein [Geminisphaera colitermitum]
MTTTITTASLTVGGWINLILSVSFVTALCVWTLIRVLRGGGKSGKTESKPKKN